MAASPRARAAFNRYGSTRLARALQQVHYPFFESEGVLRQSFRGRAGRDVESPANQRRRAKLEAYLASPQNRRELSYAVRHPQAGISRQRQSASVLEGRPRFGQPHGSVYAGHFQTPKNSPPDKKWKPIPLATVSALINRSERFGRRTLNLTVYGRLIYTDDIGPDKGGRASGTEYRFSLASLLDNDQFDIGEMDESDETEADYLSTYDTLTRNTTPLALSETRLRSGTDEQQRLVFLSRQPTSPEDARDLRRALASERNRSSAIFARMITGWAWTEVYGLAISTAKDSASPGATGGATGGAL